MAVPGLLEVELAERPFRWQGDDQPLGGARHDEAAVVDREQPRRLPPRRQEARFRGRVVAQDEQVGVEGQVRRAEECDVEAEVGEFRQRPRARDHVDHPAAGPGDLQRHEREGGERRPPAGVGGPLRRRGDAEVAERVPCQDLAGEERVRAGAKARRGGEGPLRRCLADEQAPGRLLGESGALGGQG